MKKLFALPVFLLFVVLGVSAQVNIPLGSSPSDPAGKRVRPTAKTLTGTVTDKSDAPVIGAVVYLKNTKSLEVKSYFTQDNGSYRFPQLALNTDYEVWAEKAGKKSATKTVSQFDDRFTPTINLHIDTSK